MDMLKLWIRDGGGEENGPKQRVWHCLGHSVSFFPSRHVLYTLTITLFWELQSIMKIHFGLLWLVRCQHWTAIVEIC